jgi:hypothetical protein
MRRNAAFLAPETNPKLSSRGPEMRTIGQEGIGVESAIFIAAGIAVGVLFVACQPAEGIGLGKFGMVAKRTRHHQATAAMPTAMVAMLAHERAGERHGPILGAG